MVYDVTFKVIDTNAVVTKKFYSPYLAEKFVNKIRHSKKCKLVCYPVFNK